MIRTATASSRSLRPLEVARGTLAAFALAVVGLVGCHSSGSSSPDGGGEIPCPANGSTSGSAATLMTGQTLQSKICYEASSNWYTIDVPSGNTLLDVSAGYAPTADTPVQLEVKVFYETNSTTLTLVQDLLAPNQSDAGMKTIQTTVLVTQPGSYYLQVDDAHNTNFDATNAYTLTVGYAMDPDTHEPNDTTAQAKPTDGKPGYLAYLNDLDIFQTSVGKAGDLLTLSIVNPSTAPGPVNYAVTSSSGTVLFSDIAPPQKDTFNTQVAVADPGTYFVTLSSPMGVIPSRDASAAYTLTLGSTTNPDTLDNHTLATAACPGGGSGTTGCSMAYTGKGITLPTEKSYITVPGQRDFYRVDVTSGAALVLQIGVTSASSTTVEYAVDLLTPDPTSSCQVDTDCAALNSPCNYGVNDAGVSTTTQCELSHACLPPGNYGFCPGGGSCSLCQGAGLCIPNPSGGNGVCAAPQYLSSFNPMGTKTGGPTVSTAQPLFSNGAYYINVHDASYTHTDLMNPYTLTLQMAPEPDPNDQSTDSAKRNNFYDPYPSSMSDESPNKPLAVDITAQLTAGTPVTGNISYETDNDWYSFQHPCPGMDCALDFTWTQPGPSQVQVAFYMLNDDLSLHESFAYTGSPTTSLTMPVVSSFDNQSCSQCSFASSTVSDGGAYTYYLRVADVSQKHWDFTKGGQYSVTVKKGADGCPAACSEGTSPPGCYCYCSAMMTCPSPAF